MLDGTAEVWLDEERAILRAVMNATEVGTAFFTTPGAPADRVHALRRAFDATMKDAAYLEEAKSQKMDVDPMTGEEMEKLLKTIYASPPELVQRLKTAIDQYRDRS